MKTIFGLLPFTLAILTSGCVTNQGQPVYPSGGMFGQVTVAQPVPIEGTTTNRAPSTPTPSPEEWLSRKVEPQFPARVLVAELNAFDPKLAALIHDGVTGAMQRESRLNDVEWMFTENVPWRSGNREAKLPELQEWAARFQARYVLMTQYEFNQAARIYWVPAAITICSLGLIPMPVGGEQSFCRIEFVLMDVTSGVFVLNAQGQGHAQQMGVWGWVANTGGPSRLEQQSLRAAVDQAAPLLRNALLQFHR